VASHAKDIAIPGDVLACNEYLHIGRLCLITAKSFSATAVSLNGKVTSKLLEVAVEKSKMAPAIAVLLGSFDGSLLNIVFS
jgi:hypothetical protein